VLLLLLRRDAFMISDIRRLDFRMSSAVRDRLSISDQASPPAHRKVKESMQK
jgi:hypothetical protein